MDFKEMVLRQVKQLNQLLIDFNNQLNFKVKVRLSNLLRVLDKLISSQMVLSKHHNNNLRVLDRQINKILDLDNLVYQVKVLAKLVKLKDLVLLDQEVLQPKMLNLRLNNNH